MKRHWSILLFILLTKLSAQYDYSLENLNPSSDTYGESIGVSYYSNHVTLHYFGHFT